MLSVLSDGHSPVDVGRRDRRVCCFLSLRPGWVTRVGGGWVRGHRGLRGHDLETGRRPSRTPVYPGAVHRIERALGGGWGGGRGRVSTVSVAGTGRYDREVRVSPVPGNLRPIPGTVGVPGSEARSRRRARRTSTDTCGGQAPRTRSDGTRGKFPVYSRGVSGVVPTEDGVLDDPNEGRGSRLPPSCTVGLPERGHGVDRKRPTPGSAGHTGHRNGRKGGGSV